MKKTVLVMIFLLLTLAVTASVYAESDDEYKAALKAYNSGKYNEAVRHLNVYISRKPDPSAYYLMGYSLYKLKRFDEANEFFKDAYLVEPVFTPVKTAPGEKAKVKPRRKVVTASVDKTAPAQPLVDNKAVPAKQETQKPAPTPAVAAKAEPPKVETPKAAQPKPAAPTAAKPGAPAAAATATPSTAKPAPPAASAPAAKQPAAPKPAAPAPKPVMPKEFPLKDVGGLMAIPLVMGGLFAGFALVFLGIGLAIYLFFSFCLYRIATRLNCPAAWTAWVPFLNLWAMVGSAGKPWWWIILLFIPIVGFFVAIYLWMCIVENLGKNKWLGLLVIVPIVGMVYIAILAFSKDDRPEPIITELE